MDIDKITQISDIYLKLDLYDSINLWELINRLDIPEIRLIVNKKEKLNLFAVTWNRDDFQYRNLFDFISYIKNPIWLNIDSYCINCKKEYAFNYITDYLLIPENKKNYNQFWDYLHKEIFFVSFLCSKCHNQEISFLFRIDEDNNLYKIWQYPSKIDLNINDLKWYEKLLGEKYYKELKESMVSKLSLI